MTEPVLMGLEEHGILQIWPVNDRLNILWNPERDIEVSDVGALDHTHSIV